MKFKIYSKRNNSNSRTNTPKLIEWNYINSIKKEIMESVGLIGKGALSKFESKEKISYFISDSDLDSNSDSDLKSNVSDNGESEKIECEKAEFYRYLKNINLSVYKDLDNINISVKDGENCEFKEQGVIYDEIQTVETNNPIDDGFDERKTRKESEETRKSTHGMKNNVNYRNLSGGYNENENILDCTFLESSGDIFEIDNKILNEENEINKLRDSIFNKLDFLEQKLQSIKNYSKMNDNLNISAVDTKNCNKVSVNIEDILDNIGKNFLSGLSNLIENSHDKLINAFSSKNRISVNNIRKIIFEYNEIQLENILALNNDNFGNDGINTFSDRMVYNNINTIFEYPIKGIGYWYDYGLNDKFNDRWFVSKLTSGSFFGILDSYNGDYTTNEVEKLLVSEFDRLMDCDNNIDNNKIANIILKTIINVDQKILHLSKTNDLNTGSGLISCFIFKSKVSNNYTLFSCNLGNCKGFLSRNNSIIKFNNQTNMNNNDIDCYYVVENGIGFGLYKPPFKNYYEISNTPHVLSVELSLNIDKYIVIATDSIWKVFNEEDMNEFINCIINELYTNFPKLNKNIISNILSHSIVTESLLRGVTDNLLCMTVLF
ncbi:hypothetical protein FG379_001573 [Cryptosporidium bovis]|uniref:uncharacterized protein n=1 Tax=Cryptosporidium bovis TaxID=310047 RepID=UPI003519F793|nr:hypothetical protein FG379_001573 [Cryptosporidium bovis]